MLIDRFPRCTRSNARAVVTFLLMHARWKDDDVHGEGRLVLVRGQIAYGRSWLSKQIGISERGLRTVQQRLERIGFLTIKTTNRGTIATVPDYE